MKRLVPLLTMLLGLGAAANELPLDYCYRAPVEPHEPGCRIALNSKLLGEGLLEVQFHSTGNPQQAAFGSDCRRHGLGRGQLVLTRDDEVVSRVAISAVSYLSGPYFSNTLVIAGRLPAIPTEYGLHAQYRTWRSNRIEFIYPP